MSAGGESNIQENKVNPKYQKVSEHCKTLPFLSRVAVRNPFKAGGKHLKSCSPRSRCSVNVCWSWNSLNFLYGSCSTTTLTHCPWSLQHCFQCLFTLNITPRITTGEDKRVGIWKVKVCWQWHGIDCTLIRRVMRVLVSISKFRF